MADLVAALIVTVMLIPLGLAYAELAELPPVVGLEGLQNNNVVISTWMLYAHGSCKLNPPRGSAGNSFESI